MALLSFIEAAKRFNVPETTLRYWVTKRQIVAQTEVRNGRGVAVLDEEELEAHLASKQDIPPEGQSEGNQEALSVAMKYYESKLAEQESRYDALILRSSEERQELNDRLGDLQFRLGSTTGSVQQLEERLKDSQSEAQEWQRKAEEASRPRGLWARLMGR